MKKKIYSKTNITCILQQDSEIKSGKTYLCVCSKRHDGLLMEEAVHKRLPKRNPKLYDGEYCSLVHMQNGKYQIHMKTIDAGGITDCKELAFNVYSELIKALQILD